MPIVYPGFGTFDDGGLRTNMHFSIYTYLHIQMFTNCGDSKPSLDMAASPAETNVFVDFHGTMSPPRAQVQKRRELVSGQDETGEVTEEHAYAA